jgi:NTE family protein
VDLVQFHTDVLGAVGSSTRPEGKCYTTSITGLHPGDQRSALARLAAASHSAGLAHAAEVRMRHDDVAAERRNQMTDEPAEPTAARQPGVAPNLGQIVLVLQGGGALGAYQAGVYQAMHEAGIEPDWVIGTSIGAINACIIAGNEPRQRMDRLEAFWRGVSHGAAQQAVATLPVVGPAMATWMTMAQGLGRFFRPNPLAFVSPQIALGAEAAGYYSTQPLEESLRGLVDFGRIDRHATRLTVGAANVRTSEMRYFDSRDMPLTIRHVLASGALPPAFPAIRIDGSLYWDGGILSNTPLEAVFDDYPRRSSLVFAVHLWNPAGSEPDNIWQVQHRQKDLQYSSRTATHIARQQQIHRLRHVIAELGQLLPAAD